MRTYLIQGDQISVHTSTPKSIPEDTLAVRRLGDLHPEHFPITRLVSLWNTLPGTVVIKRFKSRAEGTQRLWNALSELPLSDEGRPGSKQSQLISLLRRAEGASIDELMSATGWQAHSVRGVLSGVLRKKLGFDIERVITGSTNVYRIAS